MIARFLLSFGFILLLSNTNAQVITGFENELENGLLEEVIPDSVQMNRYLDSLQTIHETKLLTGNTYSIFNEISPDLLINYSFTGETFKEITTDHIGRFFIPLNKPNITTVYLKINDREYHPFDTVINVTNISNRHLQIPLSPRYKIVVRGRLYVGTLATEDINVTIIHKKDTTRLKTIGCYVDKENYWNCLYRGMFKHTIVFDNPDDSIFLVFKKPGFIEQMISMKVSEYDGTILPIKLSYSKNLPKFPRHNIALNYSPPISDAWSVSFNYTYMLNIGCLKRVGIGLESKMLISDVSSDIKTFPDLSSTDTSYISGVSDSTYTTGMFSPQITFWLTNPERRAFSIYAGIGFPYTIPNNKFYFQPFIGSRFYLDINKALLIELKYTNYQLDAVNYEFNSYGNALRTTNTQTFNRLMINFGLQVSF